MAFLEYSASSGSNNAHELNISNNKGQRRTGGNVGKTEVTNVTRKAIAPQTAGKRLRLSPKRPSVWSAEV